MHCYLPFVHAGPAKFKQVNRVTWFPGQLSTQAQAAGALFRSLSFAQEHPHAAGMCYSFKKCESVKYRVLLSSSVVHLITSGMMHVHS